MKKTIIKTSVLLIAIAMITSFNSFSQCIKKKYCSENEGDYDYASQSSFALLSPGDTSRATVVLYTNQTYRIYVCADEVLGDVKYQVILPERKTSRKIGEIRKDTSVTYKMDPNTGDYAYDDWGNMIVESKKVVLDTLWVTERYTFEKVLYDNKNNKGKEYYDYTPAKSGRIQVKIQLPEGDPEDEACVNVYVGRRVVGSKNFQKNQRYDDE